MSSSIYTCHIFYRAMHFNAKCGIAIACRLSVCLSVSLSVCLSVCNVGGSGAHMLEISETNYTDISPTPSLSVAQRPPIYSRGNVGKFGGD